MIHRKQGFTLVELLVVIAILSALAAMLFPVFTLAREQARATACLSNTRQIASGALLYMQDYDDVLLPARTAFAGDALTVVRSDIPVVGTLFGCEGRFRHKGRRANLCFLDGHARYLPKSPENYVQQDPRDGCWFEEYFTADR